MLNPFTQHEEKEHVKPKNLQIAGIHPLALHIALRLWSWRANPSACRNQATNAGGETLRQGYGLDVESRS
jgi:protein-S-isoprenylcysteine O-methyltransferase Ste14